MDKRSTKCQRATGRRGSFASRVILHAEHLEQESPLGWGEPGHGEREIEVAQEGFGFYIPIRERQRKITYRNKRDGVQALLPEGQLVQ